MKFSTSLSLNAAAGYESHYINFEALKTTIYTLEKSAVSGKSVNQGDLDLEQASLLLPDASDSDKIFIRLLDKELKGVSSFYESKEAELTAELDATLAEVERIEVEGLPDDADDDSDSDSDDGLGGVVKKTSRIARKLLQGGGRKPSVRRRRRASSSVSQNRGPGESLLDEEDQLSGDEVPQAAEVRDVADNEVEQTMAAAEGPARLSARTLRRHRARTASEDGMLPPITRDEDVWNANSEEAIDARIMLKLRLQGVFRELSQLKSFVSLNFTGFRKILKKYDKVLNSSCQDRYMNEVVKVAAPFTSEHRETVDDAIATITSVYAKVVTRGDKDLALRQLRMQLREHVVYERNTVWREMIGLERSGWHGQQRSHQPSTAIGLLEGDQTPPMGDDDYKTSPVSRSRWRRLLARYLRKDAIGAACGLAVFFVILNLDIMDRVEERNCLALLALATIFWAAEVIPLFATGLLIPLLIVVLRVIRSADGEDRRLSAGEASKYIFSQMFNSTIMLLLGGFTLAAGLSKHGIDKLLATRVLALAGTRPSTFLLTQMLVACFASMWISNVAAPILCFGLVKPILRTLPTQSPYGKALVLGIALASNIGGQASPIASPQNLIALEYMDMPVSWLQWFAIALPVSFSSVVLIFALLCLFYSWDKSTRINPVRPTKDPFSATQTWVSIVCLGTIALWLFAQSLGPWLGDMGVIALVPIVLLYGTGMLAKQDWESMPWAIVALAMGGIALGRAVLSSGLLNDVDVVLERTVHGLDLWPILALFGAISLVIATCVSHTVAAVLIVPIAAEIGAALEAPHPRLLIMATALVCSAACGLPVSGFPNMAAINLEDDLGHRYLSVGDFLRVGILASAVCCGVILTLGYLLMRLIGL